MPLSGDSGQHRARVNDRLLDGGGDRREAPEILRGWGL
jgi:hypothetical protein